MTRGHGQTVVKWVMGWRVLQERVLDWWSIPRTSSCMLPHLVPLQDLSVKQVSWLFELSHFNCLSASESPTLIKRNRLWSTRSYACCWCEWCNHIWVYCGFPSFAYYFPYQITFYAKYFVLLCCIDVVSTLSICWEMQFHGPLTRYVKLRDAHAPGTFSPPPDFKGNR